jgi:glycerophosphoryl diester phosphodiesterase
MIGRRQAVRCARSGAAVRGSHVAHRAQRVAHPWGRLVLGVLLALGVGGLPACGPGRFAGPVRAPGPDFLIIGHRGAPNQACENTLESFAQALRLGANALELDVSITHDGHLVLWHDWVDRVRDRAIHRLRPTGLCDVARPLLYRPVDEVALADFVQSYGYTHAGTWVPAPTLAAFASRFAPDARVRWLFLDIKVPPDQPDLAEPLFQQAVQIFRQYDALPKVVFLTPSEAIVARLHAAAQRWQHTMGERVEVVRDVEGPQVLRVREWPSSVHLNQAAEARFALWGQPVVSLQSERAFLREELQRRDAVNARRPPGARMRYVVWTINDPEEMCALVRLGVDGLLTDEPGQLATLVQHWGRPGTCPP